MKESDVQKGEKIVNKLAERITLKLFRVGCDERNFEILNRLPLKAMEIEKEWGLSPMPVNRRIKEMMEVGLLHREKRGEDLQQTEITKEFIGNIEEIKKEVILNMSKLI